MTDAKLRAAIDRGQFLDGQIAALSAELREIKKQLVTEAASRPTEHEPVKGSDGTAWNYAHVGEPSVSVIFPTDTLKESIKTDSKAFEQIEALLGGNRAINLFFEPVSALKPKANFRSTLSESLGGKVAEKILKLCTSASSAKVIFKAAVREE